MTQVSISSSVYAPATPVNSNTKFDRPFALSIGPQRSATSWLDRYLRTRGDICMPKGVKEIFFFDEAFDRGLKFYKSHYTPSDNQHLMMEITTTSFDHESAPARVFKTFGHHVTLICPLRHPVERSYSLYLHLRRYGKVSGSLQDACAQNPRILDSSRYASHLRRWQNFYPGDQIKILLQEDLERDQEQFLKQACKALNIPFMPAPEDTTDKYNVTAYSRFSLLAIFAQTVADFLRRNQLYVIINLAKKLGLKKAVFGVERPDAAPVIMSTEERAWLETQLAGEIEALEQMIGPIPQWQS